MITVSRAVAPVKSVTVKTKLYTPLPCENWTTGVLVVASRIGATGLPWAIVLRGGGEVLPSGKGCGYGGLGNGWGRNGGRGPESMHAGDEDAAGKDDAGILFGHQRSGGDDPTMQTALGEPGEFYLGDHACCQWSDRYSA